jgi:cytochrome c oxidase subunit 3
MSDAHAATIDVYEPAMEQTYNGKLAMWLFLCSEVMFFAGLLGAYMALRIGHPENFEFGHDALHTVENISIATFNTALLITSSLTMALAVLKGQQGDRAKQRIFLVITALMGLAFLGIKGYEYSVKIQHDLLPRRDLFFAFYWTLTGIHGLHILAGVLPILGLAHFSKKRDVSSETEMVGLYWHFVDLVWIFLFPLLYLI